MTGLVFPARACLAPLTAGLVPPRHRAGAGRRLGITNLNSAPGAQGHLGGSELWYPMSRRGGARRLIWHSVLTYTTSNADAAGGTGTM